MSGPPFIASVRGGSADSSSPPRSSKKLGLVMATMLVTGNMIGTGVFMLPATLAEVGSISVLGWMVATVGAAALALVFAQLGAVDPQEGGPYAYARDVFGPYMGFQTNYVYWFGNWVGNVAIALSITGYACAFWPQLKAPAASTLATFALIWLLTLANVRGVRVIGHLETWTVVLALAPILGIAVLGWFWFDKSLFLASWNVSGGSDLYAVSRSASIALWAFLGVESAAVSAGVIENPKRNIPLATLFGAILAAAVYVACSAVIMGIIPNERLRGSPAPMAEAARAAFGDAGMWLVAACVLVRGIGSLGGWMLVVGQSGKAAAGDGMFPGVFGRLNRHGVPAAGLITVSVLMTAVLVATMSPTIARHFNAVMNLSVILVVLPFFYSSVAVWKVCRRQGVHGKRLILTGCAGFLAAAYCLWVVAGGDPGTVVNALLVLLVSVPAYPFFIRSIRSRRPNDPVNGEFP